MHRLPLDVIEQKKGLFFVLLILVYIVCAMNVPVSIYSLASHDDALFMHNAYRILKGEWLGAFCANAVSSRNATYAYYSR